jgi:hypothetical protein
MHTFLSFSWAFLCLTLRPTIHCSSSRGAIYLYYVTLGALYYNTQHRIASHTYVCLQYSIIPMPFFSFLYLSTIRLYAYLHYYWVYCASSYVRAEEMTNFMFWRWIDGQEKSIAGFVFCIALFSFRTAIQNRVDSSGIRNPLYFYFVEAINNIPADSGFHWNMADSSGIGLMRTHSKVQTVHGVKQDRRAKLERAI